MSTTHELEWPAGFERTPASEREQYPHGFQVTQTRAFKNILKELGRWGASNIRIQTNGQHRSDNPAIPYKRANPDDPTVVVYCVQDGTELAIPCDRWSRLRDNAQAIAKYIEAKRALERYGVSTSRSEWDAQALPSGDEDALIAAPVDEEPHEILGVQPDAPDAVVKGAFRELVKQEHGDHGGDGKNVDRLKEARDEMLS